MTQPQFQRRVKYVNVPSHPHIDISRKEPYVQSVRQKFESGRGGSGEKDKKQKPSRPPRPAKEKQLHNLYDELKKDIKQWKQELKRKPPKPGFIFKQSDIDDIKHKLQQLENISRSYQTKLHEDYPVTDAPVNTNQRQASAGRPPLVPRQPTGYLRKDYENVVLQTRGQMQGCQIPGQMQGSQMPGQMQGSKMPGQMQGSQMPGQMQGPQMPGQMQGSQMSGQMQGSQMPGQMQGSQMPGGQYGYADQNHLNSEIRKLQEENVRLQQGISKRLEKEKERLENELKERTDDIERKRKEDSEKILKLQADVRTKETKIAKLEKDVAAMKFEKEEALTRLSEIAGKKLHDDNANIADLSSDIRPTKISEKFRECYDNEWTEAFEELTEEMGCDEEAAIRKLLKILKNTFGFCEKHLAEFDERIMGSISQFPYDEKPKTGQSSKLPQDVKSIVKDLRKAVVTDVVLRLQMKYLEDIKSSGLKTQLGSRTEVYAKKCVELTWYMVVQTPPMELFAELEAGTEVDKDLFVFYTTQGKYVDFVVWPCVRLHKGGPLLSKGVVQGRHAREGQKAETKEKIRPTETEKTAHSKNEANTRKTRDTDPTEGKPDTGALPQPEKWNEDSGKTSEGGRATVINVTASSSTAKKVNVNEAKSKNLNVGDKDRLTKTIAAPQPSQRKEEKTEFDGRRSTSETMFPVHYTNPARSQSETKPTPQPENEPRHTSGTESTQRQEYEQKLQPETKPTHSGTEQSRPKSSPSLANQGGSKSFYDSKAKNTSSNQTLMAKSVGPSQMKPSVTVTTESEKL